MTRLVLLDRDGTINVEKDHLADPDEIELLPNAAEGIRRMRAQGLSVAVVTNQSVIARGYCDWQTLDAIHARLSALLAEQGAEVDRIYVCPHHPDDQCDCRKPQPGLARAAARDFGVDLQTAVVVGDKPCDIDLGRSVGARTILVRTGYGARFASQGTGADHTVADLLEAADLIGRLSTSPPSTVLRTGALEPSNWKAVP